MKKIFYFIIVTWLSAASTAAQSVYCGGLGTATNPYQICSPQHLADLATDVNAGGNASQGKYYKLMNDIDFDGFDYGDAGGWTPIGNQDISECYFKGNFDGNGKVISNLIINRTGVAGDLQGLFGFTGGATIKNLGIENCDITGRNNVGALIGILGNNSILENCYATGNVTGTGNSVGGLVGRYSASPGGSDPPVKNCYATCSVTGNGSGIGGLIGGTTSSCSITNCYATGDITGFQQVGGLIGTNYGSITNCYATGNVSGNNYVGGLMGIRLGNPPLTNCFAFNCKVESTGTDVGRIAGTISNNMENNYAYNQMKLLANGNPVTPTPDHYGKDGANVSYISALYQSTYPTSWFSGTLPAWTFNYTNHHIAPKTNLPILTAFTKTAFPNTIQQAQMRLCGCGGDGTEADPIQICIEQDLKDLSDIVNIDLGYNASDGVYYILMNDLDFAGFDYGDVGGWIPIGNTQSVNRYFKGNFNGNGKVIRNITINRPTEDYQGVFGRVNDATFKNLGIENCNIAGGSRVGALVGGGSTTAGGLIENCYATGNVSGNATGFLSHGYIGGLAGTYTIIKNSYTTCDVTGTGTTIAWVGGLVGSVSNIENCYTTGNVSGTGNLVGGLAGRSLSIANSYATGNVTGIDYVGGLSGNNGSSDNSGFLTNSYATGNVIGSNKVGGLVGENTSLVENSYATGKVTGTDYVGGLVGSHGWSTISNCYALNPKVEALGTNVGRVAYSHISAAYSNNYAYNEMELLVNGVPITPTPNPNDKDGANVSCVQVTTPALFPTKETWLTGESPAWKMKPYENLNVTPETNLPILSIFTPSAFPNAVQAPQIEECKIFQIWNWADLAYLRVLSENGQSQSYDQYILMQYLGSPDDPTTYGDGSGKGGQNGDEPCPYTDGERMFGYYGYQNYLTQAAYIPGTTANNPLKVGGTGATEMTIIAAAWNIDHSGWIPIGSDVIANEHIFRGHFDGNGKVINNLAINRPGTDQQGLFGFAAGATIKNLGIKNCDITAKYQVGGLAGINHSSISNCYVIGNVMGDGYIGGLMGSNYEALTNCYAIGNVTGTGNFVGGLIGNHDGGNSGGAPITNCYATSTVTANGSVVGGLVGFTIYSSITNCYTTGDVSAGGSVGGLVGMSISSPITNCYAFNCKVEVANGTEVGRITGNSAGTLTNNYAHEQMELWSGSFQIPPTPNPNGKDGANVSIEQATTESQFPTPAWLTGESPAWTFNYPNYNIEEGTNLPILSAFTPSAFPNAVQAPQIEACIELFCGGSGTIADPYLICTAAQLDSVRHFLNKHFKLANDIPLSAYLAPGGEGYDKWDSEGWDPIGDDTDPFTGSLNGDGHRIIGLWINRTGDYIGLFGFIDGAVIKNVGVIISD